MSTAQAGPGSSPMPSPAPLPRRIVLTGFMGAGKSTVGDLLAARLRWPFLDIDSLITAEHGLSVARIFAHDGEEHFRLLESEAIARVLDPLHQDPAYEHNHAIVALGGGAVETEAVRDLLFEDPESAPGTVTVFLTAPLPELLARCNAAPLTTQTTCDEDEEETAVRPLLTAPEPPEDRLARRLPHYQRAHLTVDTSGVPPAEVVDRILDWLSEDWLSGPGSVSGSGSVSEPGSAARQSSEPPAL
jgi:shikimate kinase